MNEAVQICYQFAKSWNIYELSWDYVEYLEFECFEFLAISNFYILKYFYLV